MRHQVFRALDAGVALGERDFDDGDRDVQRDVAHLRERRIEAALREGRLTYEESGEMLRFYEEGLHGYTYMEDVHEQ